MNTATKQGFNTTAVHGGYHVRRGPVNPPLERSSTYIFESCQDGADRFAGSRKSGIYTRLHNPGVEVLESRIAALEHGFGGIATASGMAAVEAIFFHFLEPGAHLVATSSVYGPSRTIIESHTFYERWGIRATFLDTANIDAVRRAVTMDNTKLLYVETPANPTLAITDIAAMADIACHAQIPLVVDNTFCSPYLQNPILQGADVVVHSMTKSIGGHANAVGGIIIAARESDYFKLRHEVVNRGAILSPDNADLFGTGVKTLGLRMERMQQNAVAMAEYLNHHPKVEWVRYPGFADHCGHKLIGGGRQMRGPGSMLTFGVWGGYDAAVRLLDHLDLVTLAVSLGGVESLIEHPASMTHAGVPHEDRVAAGITDDLIRFSSGIEELGDLRRDFDQAFEYLEIEESVSTLDSKRELVRREAARLASQHHHMPSVED